MIEKRPKTCSSCETKYTVEWDTEVQDLEPLTCPFCGREVTFKKNRKSPSQSATLYEEGIIEKGNDKQLWVVKKNKNNTKRWVPYHSAEIFGYTPLTAKILKKNINKPIIVFERQFKYDFPKKRSDFDVKYCFTPSGDAELYKKKRNKNI